jgi:hypothetical protein
MENPRLAILEKDWKLPKNRKYIRREFCRALTKLGIKIDPFYVEIRSPHQNRLAAAYFNWRPNWHKDNFKKGWIIIWSNSYPTLIRERRTKRRVSIPSKSIVLFDNDYYRHRQDLKGVHSKTRWLVRYHVFEGELPKRFKKPVWALER